MTPPISEIIFLDGPENPTFVIVYNNDDVHYFYWPYEFTASKNPIKSNDVEPVKVQKNIVLSRFHYYGLTIWINPKMDGNLPIISFTGNWHSPIAIHDDDVEIEKFPLENYDTIPWMERGPYWLGKFAFEKQIQSTKLTSPRGYNSKIVIPQGDLFEEKILFDRNYIFKFIKELIIIGEKNDISNLIYQIKKKDSKNKLTVNSITKFFNFN
jgi:hypothetical protein